MDDIKEIKHDELIKVEVEPEPLLLHHPACPACEDKNVYLQQAQAVSLIIGSCSAGMGVLILICLPFIAAMNHIAYQSEGLMVSTLVPLMSTIVYYGWRRYHDK